MKIAQIPHYTKSDESIIIINESVSDSLFSDLETILITHFKATKAKEIRGLDQIYIDIQIDEDILTLAYDSMAGISLECTNTTLREKIVTYLENYLVGDNYLNGL